MYNIGHYIITYTSTSWIIAQLQQTQSHRSFVYSWAHNSEDSITTGQTYRQPTPHFGDSFMARRATLGVALARERLFGGMTKATVAAMKADNIDLVHAHYGRAGYYALPMIQQMGVPLVTSFYGYDASEYPSRYPAWRENYKKLFAKAGCVLCLGANMRNTLIGLGCPPEKAHIHHLGVNVERITYQPRVWQPHEPLRILIASAFRERKGIPYALEALAKFRKEVPLEITIIGDAPDHPDGLREKKKILAALKEHDLFSSVSMMGNQPYSVLLEEAYKHHIFMGPSITAVDGDMEGTPMVLVDVAATGMPIISTYHSDVPEIIRHEETGLLAQERDSEGLLQHLRWFARNVDKWEAMLFASRHHIEAEFSQEIQNNRLGQIYHRLLKG